MIRARFFVAGTPAPQGSKNLATKDRRGRALAKPRMYEQSKKLGPWRAAVAAEAMIARQRCGTLTGPLALTATFLFARPKRPAHPYPPIDLDKCLRAVGDALVHGHLLTDDRIIVHVTASKGWCTSGAAGCSIILEDAHD